MIIESVEITENGVTFNQVSNGDNDYFYCVYDGIICLSMPDFASCGKTGTVFNIFGADTFFELEIERINRGINGLN
jgi:hypothetical protein